MGAGKRRARLAGRMGSLELRKALWQAKLDVVRADHQARRDQEKADHQAELDAAKAETVAHDDRMKADYATYYAKMGLVYQAYIDTAKAAIDRTQNRAMYITTAATAISTLYTGLLGFRFVKDVNDKIGPSMPVRGITPLIFFGIAIALATFYLSFLSQRTDSIKVAHSDFLVTDANNALAGYLQWVKAMIEPRLAYLRGSVVSLTCGVIALPLVFVDLQAVGFPVLVAVLLGIVVIMVVVTWQPT